MKEMGKTLLTGIRCVGILFMLMPAFLFPMGCRFPSLSGVFTDSPVAGLAYEGDALSGTTDADGTFEYYYGDTVTFSIGDLLLGSATGSKKLSPIDLIEGAVDGADQRVNNICVLLQTLDQDGDLNNGIQISNEISKIVSDYADTVDFDQATADFAADADVTALLTDLNAADVFTDLDPRPRKLRSAAEARDHLARTLSERKVVKTQSGWIRGYDPVANTVYGGGEGMWQFIGIPYAKPPVFCGTDVLAQRE